MTAPQEASTSLADHKLCAGAKRILALQDLLAAKRDLRLSRALHKLDPFELLIGSLTPEHLGRALDGQDLVELLGPNHAAQEKEYPGRSVMRLFNPAASSQPRLPQTVVLGEVVT